MIIESTYGDRLHQGGGGDVVGELAATIQRALDRGGNLVIRLCRWGGRGKYHAIREIKQRGL